MALTAIDSSLLIPAVVPWHAEHVRADRVVARATNLRMIGQAIGSGSSSSDRGPRVAPGRRGPDLVRPRHPAPGWNGQASAAPPAGDVARRREATIRT